jgi:hypothetical protein
LITKDESEENGSEGLTGLDDKILADFADLIWNFKYG